MSRRRSSSANKSIRHHHHHHHQHRTNPVFANCFSDDMSNDMSTHHPSMYDHMRDQVVALTALPRRKLRHLLVLSMIMTLTMALLSVHSMRILTRMGLVSLRQQHDQFTNNLLTHLSTRLVAAGLINNSSIVPLPHPPHSCKYKPPLCHLSLPWLYGSVISLTCALGALQTISRVRKDSRDHAHEMHLIRVGLGGAGLLFCFGIFEFFV
ncbi:hypothetical protein B0F90DRAFT_1725414 [Multifurca ochricompacta]|uniref:Uncharacterized protein n=1 Tax=Multifurca ochricompacta TaxID=376703 RepID=A0AAD4M593_9AGAM|nr:hypothetical protein B0F90DRAFT_1725414 [Multifurca ochricompacta]